MNFEYNHNFQGMEFLPKNDSSKYELKGKYIKAPIKMTWSRDGNCKGFQLIDRLRNDTVVAEISGFTLDNMDLGQINIINLVELDFLEFFIGTACMVYFKEAKKNS
ncbi:hypothetical protein CONCODRAFT_80308 [Conidiobolus coronatus NRRL 28638]|uniref:Uncharacterized protein n=1 Tax=Conidiobolus coronatus (strain ATCC 28846 / CBS 209.66 / NRRL 28638) TaxID=796925 RepID=A0A137NW40_CONC2|nr:hypothetical protein CONCODRAFT_80308 [Conidiobolus coronatus NRRL 28638]|eukprot:KXN67023.1 hypothetical protein CONCODRAFT_80308 [Conidiobolus coronatus NRRL 28638]